MRALVRIAVFRGILAVFLSSIAMAQTPANKPSLPAAYTDTVRRVVAARTEVVGAAAQLRADCEKKKEDCVSAAAAYNKAKGAYDGWISVMKLAIKQGKSRNLKIDDPDYRAVAEPAAKASAGFLEYAEQALTGQTKAAGPAILSIVDFGVKLWKEIRNLRQEQRDLEAERFAKEVSWPTWAEVR